MKQERRLSVPWWGAEQSRIAPAEIPSEIMRERKSKGGRKVQRYDTPKAIRAEGPDKKSSNIAWRWYLVT